MKIGQCLTKLCVEHLGFTFLAHSVESIDSVLRRIEAPGRWHFQLICNIHFRPTRLPPSCCDVVSIRGTDNLPPRDKTPYDNPLPLSSAKPLTKLRSYDH